jgi:hypothetical protein
VIYHYINIYGQMIMTINHNNVMFMTAARCVDGRLGLAGAAFTP